MLAERLGMTVSTLLHTTTSAEISEWMAFDRLKDEQYRSRIETKNMTDEQRLAAQLKMFGR